MDIAFLLTKAFNNGDEDGAYELTIEELLECHKIKVTQLPKISKIVVEIDDEKGNTHLLSPLIANPISAEIMKIMPTDTIIALVNDDFCTYFTAEQ
jgi:hypothetical protein